MGIPLSKSTEETTESKSDEPVVTPVTPIVAAQIRRLTLDPRSPSVGIDRTPIEVLKTPIKDNSEATSSNAMDPRSPTVEFCRTPVTVTATLTKPLHNKILDNARQSLITVTPVKTAAFEKVVKKIATNAMTPKLLESNLITPVKLNENKRNSLVGLLETNMDYVETDLDVVIQNKAALADAEPLISSTEANIIDEDGSPTEDNSLTIIPEFEEVENSAQTEQNVELNVSEVQLEEFDKKLSNLIYEDEHKTEDSPRTMKAVTKQHRTPLGDRNFNNQQRRGVPKLKVSDRPLKGNCSKIPVFKDNKCKVKISVQCENTPPRVKPKHSQWSAEDSLVI